MSIFVTLETDYGFWNPAVWIIVMLVATLIAYLIWAYGESSYKRGTEQVKPFISGNAEPPKGTAHVSGGHLYWGFTEALKGYYDRVVPVHSGVLNDYVLWFLGTMVLLVIIVGLI